MEKLFENPLTYIDEDHYRQAIDSAQIILMNAEKVSSKGISECLMARLEILKDKMNSLENKPVLLEHVLDGRKLKSFDRKGLLKHVAKTIIDNYSASKTPEDILQQIFADFTKSGYTNHKVNGAVYSGK